MVLPWVLNYIFESISVGIKKLKAYYKQWHGLTEFLWKKKTLKL